MSATDQKKVLKLFSAEFLIKYSKGNYKKPLEGAQMIIKKLQ